MSVLEITKETFDDEVLKSDKPVLLDFYASWCGPCKMLMPVVEQIASETTELKVVKVNVDVAPELASAFEVTSVPALFAFKDGKVVNQSLGVIPKQAILDLFK